MKRKVIIAFGVLFVASWQFSCVRVWECRCESVDLTGVNPDTTYVFDIESTDKTSAESSCTSGTYENSYETYTCTFEE